MFRPPDPPVDREQLLAKLVMAHRKDPRWFEANAGARWVSISHPGLDGLLFPNWDHVEQLAAENRLHLSGSTPHWIINLPEHVVRNNVFIVHGRDHEALDTMVALLHSVRLEPRTFEDARRLTGKPSPYLGEVLEAAFAYAQAFLVLFTPDERVELREELRQEGESSVGSFQPRPNVLLEAGMALAMHRDRTVIVEMGAMREVSDLGGIHLVRWRRDTPEKRAELLDRLAEAGCRPDRSGNRWMTVGRRNR